MRRRIYNIIEPLDDNSKVEAIYDIFMLICIIASMVPIAIKSEHIVLTIIDRITVSVFIADYILRLITADFKLDKGIRSFALYPLTPMAIIDLLSILPSFIPMNSGFKVLRLLRLGRTLKVFRSLKIFRYSKNIDRIITVLKNQSNSLCAVASMALFYVFFTALIMFNIEPDTFKDFFEALYWSAISLASVGYGDIIPITVVGRLFTMISALIGVAVVALPSCIIIAGYLEILNEEKENKK
ncbi:MAG: potassium channel family protein [Eubacterium sp.]|nr:potassium channel family protein [Eubacterium sp.]